MPNDKPTSFMEGNQVTEHFKYTDLTCPCCDRVKLIPLVKQHMEMLNYFRGGDKMVRIASRIDDLADRVEQEVHSPPTEEP